MHIQNKVIFMIPVFQNFNSFLCLSIWSHFWYSLLLSFLKYNLHNMVFTNYKCKIWWVLTSVNSRETNSTIKNIKRFDHPQTFPHDPLEMSLSLNILLDSICYYWIKYIRICVNGEYYLFFFFCDVFCFDIRIMLVS